MWYKNIAGRFFGFVTKHACDGQNYDSQDRANIAASRGNNKLITAYTMIGWSLTTLFSTNTAISEISIHNAGLQYAKCNTVAFPVQSATVNKLPSQFINYYYHSW